MNSYVTPSLQEKHFLLTGPTSRQFPIDMSVLIVNCNDCFLDSLIHIKCNPLNKIFTQSQYLSSHVCYSIDCFQTRTILLIMKHLHILSNPTIHVATGKNISWTICCCCCMRHRCNKIFTLWNATFDPKTHKVDGTENITLQTNIFPTILDYI